MSLFNELKRRNVFKVGIAYVVVAWLVAQVLQLIFESFGTPEWVMKTVLVLMAAGLLFALFFAWAFEMTPEGLKRESEVDRTQSITPQTGKKLNNLIFVVMALAIVYFAYDKFVLSVGRETAAIESAMQEATTQALEKQPAEPAAAIDQVKSIAVLPFIDMSADKDQEYLSDGIAEELLNLLARVQGLRVTSRSSAFSYKGKEFKIAEVGQELNVAHILEGSVRKAGNQVRITAQLIDVQSDTHLWSQTYDRTLDNIFAIQDEIAGEVVSQLKVALLGAAPTARETDPAAYALFLQARHMGVMGNAEQLTQAIELFEQVLEIDPTYSEAWSELGRAQINQAGFSLVSEESANKLGRESLLRALEIDPNNATALSRLGWVEMTEGNLGEAARHLQAALELEPGNDAVLLNSAQLLGALGRRGQAIELHERAVVLNPTSAQSHLSLASDYYSEGRLEDAMNSVLSAERLSPDYWGVPFMKGNMLMLGEDYESALAAYALESDPEYRARGTAMAAFSLGRTADFERALETLIQGWGDQWPSEVAAVYIWAGDYDSAFEWLEKSARISESQLASNQFDPMLAGIQEDPRWLPFLESIGRSSAQLDAIEFVVKTP